MFSACILYFFLCWKFEICVKSCICHKEFYIIFMIFRFRFKSFEFKENSLKWAFSSLKYVICFFLWYLYLSWRKYIVFDLRICIEEENKSVRIKIEVGRNGEYCRYTSLMQFLYYQKWLPGLIWMWGFMGRSTTDRDYNVCGLCCIFFGLIWICLPHYKYFIEWDRAKTWVA